MNDPSSKSCGPTPRTGAPRDKHVARRAWGIPVAHHALVLGVGCLVLLAGLDRTPYGLAYPLRAGAKQGDFSMRLTAWDSASYLALSREGYQARSPVCAFYPLWPGMIFAFSVAAPNRPLVVAMVLSNVLSVVALWLLGHLLAAHCGHLVSRNALILTLAFPGALFFCFPYTESLYLLLAALFFVGLERQDDLAVAIPAFLMPLTRAVGVFVLFPLAWDLYERRRRGRHWLLLAAPLGGYILYFGLMHAWTGNALEGFDAQKGYPNSPSIANIFNLRGCWRAFCDAGSLDGMVDSALDRGMFLLFIAVLPLVYRLNRTWFWYALPTGLVPALTSYFMSYRRYLIVCFPVFVVLAQLLARAKSRWLFWYYIVVLGALQVWAVTRFVSYRWAG